MQETIFDPTVINIDAEAVDEPFEYFDPLLTEIKNIDIQNFNFEIFEKYIEELTADEFTELWNSKLLPVMQEINDKYLVVDLDEFAHSDTETNQIMTIKYIEFLMSVLPYKIVFAKYLKKPFASLLELNSWLDSRDISEDIGQLLEDEIVVIKNMYDLIKTTIYESKKTNKEFQQRIDKLASYIKYEEDFKNYFIDIVKDTENEKLKNLILKYYANEYI